VEDRHEAGRPLAFGRVLNSSFIGLPGNPVSSFVTFLIFVRPFLLKTQGATTSCRAPSPRARTLRGRSPMPGRSSCA